jgi:preprotein translocase subunit SecG
MLSSKLLTILSLVACLCMVGVLLLQGLEFAYYGAEPSLWP